MIEIRRYRFVLVYVESVSFFVNYYTKAIAWDILSQIGCEMLTHIYLVDPSILIKWTSPFPVLGVFGVLIHFDFICYRNSCYQTV